MHPTVFPPEIFQAILTHLDIDAVKALRLTDRKLAAKCIGPRFIRSLQPVFDVSLHTLRSLQALSRNPTLSKEITSLAIFATIVDYSELEEEIKSGSYYVVKHNGPMFTKEAVGYSPEGLSNAKADLEWLKEQQQERTKESSSEMAELLTLALKGFSRLDSICLDGAVVMGRTKRESSRRGTWHPFWLRASKILSWVLKAMVQSPTSLKNFNVYESTLKCCISSGHITTYLSDLNSEELRILGKDLNLFKLGMCGEIQDDFDIPEPKRDTEGKPDAEGESHTESESESEKSDYKPPGGYLSLEEHRAILDGSKHEIASLLKSAPALRELNLSFRHTLPVARQLDSYDRIIESIAHEMHSPMLEKASFAGFMAKGESILLFLQKHPNLRSLKIHECFLTTGSWTPIFAHINQSMPRLEHLDLSNLNGKRSQNTHHAEGRVPPGEPEGEHEVDG